MFCSSCKIRSPRKTIITIADDCEVSNSGEICGDKHLRIATENCAQIEFPLSNLEGCLYPKASGILTCPWKNFLACPVQWPHAFAVPYHCTCAAGCDPKCTREDFWNRYLSGVLHTTLVHIFFFMKRFDSSYVRLIIFPWRGLFSVTDQYTFNVV